MKSSNLAWRSDPFESQVEADPPQREAPAPQADANPRVRPRPTFDRRTIEIRDQGFGMFRVR